MGQTDETDASVFCQLPLDSPAQGRTCAKPCLAFSSAPVQRLCHGSLHGSVHISCKPGAHQLRVGLVHTQLHSWRWGMCSPAQMEKSKHRIIPSPYVTNDVMTLVHLSPQGHILPAGSSRSLSISALRILN